MYCMDFACLPRLLQYTRETTSKTLFEVNSRIDCNTLSKLENAYNIFIPEAMKRDINSLTNNSLS